MAITRVFRVVVTPANADFEQEILNHKAIESYIEALVRASVEDMGFIVQIEPLMSNISIEGDTA